MYTSVRYAKVTVSVISRAKPMREVDVLFMRDAAGRSDAVLIRAMGSLSLFWLGVVAVAVAGTVVSAIGVGVYKPKHSDLSTMACIASAGRGFAQYIHSWAKAEVRAGMLMREGSVEMRKPSRVQVWWWGLWCEEEVEGVDIGLVWFDLVCL